MSQQLEGRMVTDWLDTFHRDALKWKRQRLGEPLNKEEAALYSVLLRWVDAVFVENGTVYLVEAKLRPDAGAIGQLMAYDELFPKTPDFTQYKDAPRVMVLLTTMEDKYIRESCERRGILYVSWKPDWL